jgi:hypothetical protein
MANFSIQTPRFYPDMISYLLSRGVALSEFAVTDTDTGNFIGDSLMTTGSTAELFDMRPLNKVTFNTSSDTGAHVLVTIDTQSAASKKSFVAILNHNMTSADAKVRIMASDTEGHIQAADMGSATEMTNPVEVVNADAIASSIVTPGSDGSTIVRFDEMGLKYWGIQFEGDGSNTFDGSTSLFVGCIMIGEYFDMPNAPDLAVKRSIAFDKVSVQESIGGQRYSNTTSFGKTASTTTKSPFLGTNQTMRNIYGGRTSYDMNFSYLNATDLMPDEVQFDNADDNVIVDIWNKTNGSALPFIFSIDNSSSEEGNHGETQHLFARFAQDSLDMTQVANDVWNMSMRIEEEF